MSERTPLPAAYIAKVHSAAQRTCGSVERRRDWPNSEWSSPVIVMSLCSEIARLNIELQRAADERDELQQIFDLQWKADLRAVERWQQAHPGNDLVWPDRADMVVWLMEQYGDHVSRSGETSDV